MFFSNTLLNFNFHQKIFFRPKLAYSKFPIISVDPWSGGGVLKTQSTSVNAVILPEGAHHLDLREDNIADPATIQAARKFYLKTFREWIDTYNKF